MYCKTCPAWDQQGNPADGGSPDGGMGFCRVDPPVVLLVGAQQTIRGNVPAFQAVTPQSGASDWCMRHPARAKAQESLKFDPLSGEFNRAPTIEEAQRIARQPIEAS